MSVSELETERDFYFSKLRDIELLCHEHEDNEVVPLIMEIMYATQVREKNCVKVGMLVFLSP